MGQMRKKIMENLNSTVVRTPIGKIKMVKYHQIPNGRIFMINEVLDYYGTFTVNEGCICDGSAKAVQTYRVQGGNVPIEKAMII